MREEGGGDGTALIRPLAALTGQGCHVRVARFHALSASFSGCLLQITEDRQAGEQVRGRRDLVSPDGNGVGEHGRLLETAYDPALQCRGVPLSPLFSAFPIPDCRRSLTLRRIHDAASSAVYSGRWRRPA